MTKKQSSVEIATVAVTESFGEGGVIFSDIRAEFPELSGCNGAQVINRFYSGMRDRLREYAAEHLRELGETEFAELGSGVARFRFRRYTLVHTFEVTWSDGRRVSILRRMHLRRGAQTLAERVFGEVFDAQRGRFLPPESFASRSAIKKTLRAEPPVKVSLANKCNFYTDGKRVVFLLGDGSSDVRYAEMR